MPTTAKKHRSEKKSSHKLVSIKSHRQSGQTLKSSNINKTLKETIDKVRLRNNAQMADIQTLLEARQAEHRQKIAELQSDFENQKSGLLETLKLAEQRTQQVQTEAENLSRSLNEQIAYTRDEMTRKENLLLGRISETEKIAAQLRDRLAEQQQAHQAELAQLSASAENYRNEIDRLKAELNEAFRQQNETQAKAAVAVQAAEKARHDCEIIIARIRSQTGEKIARLRTEADHREELYAREIQQLHQENKKIAVSLHRDGEIETMQKSLAESRRQIEEIMRSSQLKAKQYAESIVELNTAVTSAKQQLQHRFEQMEKQKLNEFIKTRAELQHKLASARQQVNYLVEQLKRTQSELLQRQNSSVQAAEIEKILRQRTEAIKAQAVKQINAVRERLKAELVEYKSKIDRQAQAKLDQAAAIIEQLRKNRGEK